MLCVEPHRACPKLPYGNSIAVILSRKRHTSGHSGIFVPPLNTKKEYEEHQVVSEECDYKQSQNHERQ